MSLDNNLTPAVAAALDNFSAEEVKRRRDETGEGMMAVKRQMKRENIGKAIESAETPADFRAILTEMLGFIY